jgi:hypothetical protein
MVRVTRPELDVAAYAALSAALSDPERSRDEVLAEHGLSEEAWAEIDEAWQERLSAAMDAPDDGGVPPLVAAYAEAFARARRPAVSAVLSLERFAEATREIQRRGDPSGVLARLGIPLTAFLKANEHWTRRMIEDPDVAQRFRRALGLR